MTDKRLLSGLALSILLLGGCATMDSHQCRGADWRLIGYQDGASGKQAGVIGTYREDCAEYAVVPDLDAYLAGRNAGLKEYCQPEKAYQLGISGHGYNPVCPAASAGAFHSAYADGRNVYNARSVVKSTHSRIRKRELEISELQHDKQQKLGDLVKRGLTGEQRVRILYDIHNIEQQISALEEELDTLRHDLSHQQEYLATLTR